MYVISVDKSLIVTFFCLCCFQSVFPHIIFLPFLYKITDSLSFFFLSFSSLHTHNIIFAEVLDTIFNHCFSYSISYWVFFLYVCVKYFLVLCLIITCNLWWKFYLLKFILRNIIYFLFFHFQVQMENKLKAVIYCDIKVSWWFIGACFSFGIMIIPII